MRRRGTALAKRLILPVVAVVVGPLTFLGLTRTDPEHERFYNDGKSINTFLKRYCAALETSFEVGEVDAVASFYAPNYFSPARGRWVLEPAPLERDVEIQWLDVDGSGSYGKPEVLLELSHYLRELSTIQETTCKILLIEKLDPGRQAVLTVRYVLDGADHEGKALQDRYVYRWHLEAAPESVAGWMITRDGLVEGSRVASRELGFVDIELAATGIDYVHQRDPYLDMEKRASELKFDMIQHAPGGISAADYDQDGRPDVFFTDGVRSRLYKNGGVGPNGEPRFVDVTQESGLDGIGQATSALFADFDNDGDRDLFVSRYLASNLLFRNNGDGTFIERSAEMGLALTAPSFSATLLDYDRDGYLDLYLGLYGDAFESVPRLPFLALNGHANRLFRNDRGERFLDMTEESGTGDPGWTLAVASGDYDGDGWPDLVVANDFGRKSLYRNEGDGTFIESAKEAGAVDISGGMGVAFGDFNDDGKLDLYTSNIQSNQRWFGEELTTRFYLQNVLRTRWALLDAGEYWKLWRLLGSSWRDLGTESGEGNSLLKNNGDGTFTELDDSRTNVAGWGWSVAFLDFDNDTDLDLYAANGWISNTPGTDL